MTRADRGIERLDFRTWNVLLGGLGGNPSNVGVKGKPVYVAPRIGAAYRIDDNTVFRTGYGITVNPLPWSRPLRGFFPATVAFSQAAAGNNFIGSLDQGIPPIATPDLSTGSVLLPRGVDMRTPNLDHVDRALLHQWNVTLERRLPLDLVTSIAYVGTQTNGGYAFINQNYAEPGGGEAGRRYFAQAGSASIQDWGNWTTSKYHSMQVAVNRPFKNGLLLKGAYTWSQAMNMADEDGWQDLMWNISSQFDRNYARAGFDRTHVLQMGFVYELPWLRESSSILGYVVKNWQVNGIYSAFSGTPFSISGNNPQLLAPGAGSVTADQNGGFNVISDPSRDVKWVDVSVFSNPQRLAIWQHGPQRVPRAVVWNLDLSLFRNIPIGRYRMEFRAQASNVLNHTRWLTASGGIDTNLNSPTFMQFVSSTASNDLPRVIQLGLRFQF